MKTPSIKLGENDSWDYASPIFLEACRIAAAEARAKMRLREPKKSALENASTEELRAELAKRA